ncbi:unnamed protein product, partial [marine sediment metagenome]
IFRVFSTQYSKKSIKTIPVGIFSVFKRIVGSTIFFLCVLSFFGQEHFSEIFKPFFRIDIAIYMGVIISLGLFVWYKGMTGSTSSNLAIANSFQPVAGVMFAYIIVGEIPSRAQLFGGITIMTGVFIALITVIKTGQKKRLDDLSESRSFTDV